MNDVLDWATSFGELLGVDTDVQDCENPELALSSRITLEILRLQQVDESVDMQIEYASSKMAQSWEKLSHAKERIAELERTLEILSESSDAAIENAMRMLNESQAALAGCGRTMLLEQEHNCQLRGEVLDLKRRTVELMEQARAEGAAAERDKWAFFCEERALEWSGTASVRGLNGAARDCAAARALEASCIADKIRSAEEAQG